MLFDLRGRGRRRTVQTIYLGLALLMGIGLVGFGIGGGFGGGGILSGVGNSEGSGSASYASQIKKLQKQTLRQPNNIGAWERLTNAQLHEAGGEAYVSNGGPTAKGRELFSQTAVSWEHYLALNPPKPSVPLAKEMLRLFGEEGLNRPASAVQVLQIVVAAEPDNAAYYSLLAQYAYKARNTRVGDLAAAKAVKLAPPEQRARVKTELQAAKKSPSGGETLTGTTNGKTFTVKSNGRGGYSGAVPQSTSTTPGSSTPAKK
ncbi:MAG: hypothetical protein E6G34_13010 [Actinobacteria bacterium]|nr:MAG: hypothetical protein E6G34_13010 [Actinomycetota bacterium]